MSLTADFFAWRFGPRTKLPDPLPEPGLRDCPFCGGTPKSGSEHQPGGHGGNPPNAFIRCKCGAGMVEYGYGPKELERDIAHWQILEAARRWNERV